VRLRNHCLFWSRDGGSGRFVQCTSEPMRRTAQARPLCGLQRKSSTPLDRRWLPKPGAFSNPDLGWACRGPACATTHRGSPRSVSRRRGGACVNHQRPVLLFEALLWTVTASRHDSHSRRGIAVGQSSEFDPLLHFSRHREYLGPRHSIFKGPSSR